MNLVIPMLGLTAHGGNRVLVAIANALVADGHHCCVLTPRQPSSMPFKFDARVEVRYIGPRVSNKPLRWMLFVLQLTIYAFHEFSEAGALPLDNAYWHIATEPYGPDGEYGHWLSYALVLIPLNLDPPEHTFFRQILMRHFGPATIKKLEPRIRSWAQQLVGAVKDKGRCNFSDAVGSIFPVSIFMELMGLPLERLAEYRAVVVEYFTDVSHDRRIELEKTISGAMSEVIEARKLEPRDDMASKLLNDEVGGRRLTATELDSLCNL